MSHIGEGPPTNGSASRRVLVVDDNMDGALAVSLLLKIEGHEARTAYNAHDALETARAFLPEVVLLDIRLPDRDGFDVARELRAEPSLRNVVLVALSGWGREEDRSRSEEAGFNHYLVKPTDPDRILSILRDLPPSTTTA